jgi:hypothetical protein
MVIFAALGVAGAAILWVYNVNQQLRPEQLAAARKLWEEKGPADYTLTITKEGSATGTFVVTVRGGKVLSVMSREKVVKDGQPQVQDRPLEKRLYSYYDMDALFDDVQAFLKIKQDPNKGRVFLRAHFDPEDGHLEEYVYSNAQENQRVQVVVELRRDRPGKPSHTSPAAN